jgi:peptidyl-prolyl cis-trans isomerase SurA
MRAVIAALLGLSIAASTAESQESEVIERVVAVVNDEAIFLSELRERAAPFLARVLPRVDAFQRPEAISRIRTEVLQRMIEEELIEEIGREMNVRVTDREVEAAIQRVASQAGVASGDLPAIVREQTGMDFETYRRDLRVQLFRYKVVNQRVRARVNITEEQVEEQYRMRAAQAERTSEFRAEHIFVRIPDGASAAEQAAVLERIQEVRDEITSVADFEEAQARVGGSDLGWIQQGQIAPELEAALLELDAGQISEPIRGPSGYSIFLIRERRQGDADIPPYAQVRQQLFQEMYQEAVERQERVFLEELRRDAVVDVRL